MDTRTKIVSLAAAQNIAAQRKARWFTGYFDPLLADHVGLLAESSSPGELLIVAIADPPTPLLNRRARAELVAALASVDYVVEEAMPENPSSAPDEDLRTRFIEDVRIRSNGVKA